MLVLGCASLPPGATAPPWTTDPCTDFEGHTHLCAVGSGSDAASAAVAARLELAQTYRREIQAEFVVEDVLRARAVPTDRSERFGPDVHRVVALVVDEVLRDARIASTWLDPVTDRHLALAVLDRTDAAVRLGDGMDRVRRVIEELLLAADRTDDPIARLGLLTAAFGRALALEAVDLQRRFLDPDGTPPWANPLDAIRTRRERLRASHTVQIEAGAPELREALGAAVEAVGMRETTETPRYLLRVTHRVDPVDRRDPRRSWARWEAGFVLVDLGDDVVVLTTRRDGRDAHVDPDALEALSRRRAGQALGEALLAAVHARAEAARRD